VKWPENTLQQIAHLAAASRGSGNVGTNFPQKNLEWPDFIMDEVKALKMEIHKTYRKQPDLQSYHAKIYFLIYLIQIREQVS
jgi:hypothetical protein